MVRLLTYSRIPSHIPVTDHELTPGHIAVLRFSTVYPLKKACAFYSKSSGLYEQPPEYAVLQAKCNGAVKQLQFDFVLSLV